MAGRPKWAKSLHIEINLHRCLWALTLLVLGLWNGAPVIGFVGNLGHLLHP